MRIGLGLNTVAGKVLASTAVLASAATVASLGTFGAFTGTTSADLSVSSGTVKIQLGTANTNANRLTVAATGVVPGDTIERAADITNTGDTTMPSIKLDTTATTSSLLDTDATNGLQLKIESCAAGWTETTTGGVAPFTYTCPGNAQTTVLASTRVVGANRDLGSLASLTPGGTDHLRVTLTFPSAAGNTFQGLNSVINFTFNGAQRAAGSR